MKHPNDRLYNVVIIGATPAGLAATNKLGELGIPVTLVDSEPDLDSKLSVEEHRLKSGSPLNYAHRPGLIRLMRNPGVRCILPAEVTSIKHNPRGFSIRIRRSGVFVDRDRCILCGRCMTICPVTLSNGEKPVRIGSRSSLPGRAVIDKRREPLCQAECPLHVNVQGYMALAREGRYAEALELIRRDNALPGICGRICTRPCESACRQSDVNESLAIRDIKRFLADYGLSNPVAPEPAPVPEKEEKIAIIGSGPAGLAAAVDLARFGCRVTVFEKEKEAGGLLRYGIGPHRLPRDILDAELETIRALGVEIKTSHPVDIPGGMETIQREYDAVILTIGSWADRMLGVPGEELEGVEGGLAFLNAFHRGEITSLKEKTAVIGDGNAAFDLARTLNRIGADVTIISWFPAGMIPADPEEVRAAAAEGIVIEDRLQVTAFEGADGRVERLRCIPTKPGKPDALGIPWPVPVPGAESVERSFRRVFVAIGQAGEHGENALGPNITVTDHGFIAADDRAHTSFVGVYAAGDAVSGPGAVVQAMAAGRNAANAVLGDLFPDWRTNTDSTPARPDNRDFDEIPLDLPIRKRPAMPELGSAARKGNFTEVALGFDAHQVASEADRCLQCGACSQCLQCVDACGEIDAIRHGRVPEEIVDRAGVVIIADPAMAPDVKGGDVIRAYGPKTAKPDVNAMIQRGFAASARAMVLLGETSRMPRGRGLSFSPPDPGLAPEIRVGVFACRCNDSLGWMDGMDDYIRGLVSREEIVHADVMTSACVPEGASRILNTIREKGITRVVLASCVCCPLDFVCGACTDQRSRLKAALFTATGVSRAMVETCNLRGEVLRLVEQAPGEAMTRFSGLMDRSIKRAAKLIAFPTVAREFNFTIAVIGETEAGLSSARTLAEAGLEVFLFGTAEKPITRPPAHPNIHVFEGGAATGVSGTLGNFQVSLDSGDFRQTLQVGGVILGEKLKNITLFQRQENLPARTVPSAMQKAGVPGTPFFYPGQTSISGLFLADPPSINISKRKKGAAAAVLAAAQLPLGPRQIRGYTVVINEDLCRGCGRCMGACPYQAITFQANAVGGWRAGVDEALCKGCGNCISVCPSNAADSPYRNQVFLEQAIEEVLTEKVI